MYFMPPLDRDFDNDLPNVLTRAEILDSLHCIFKREHTIDMRLQLIRVDKTEHICMKLLRPDVNSAAKFKAHRLVSECDSSMERRLDVPDSQVLQEHMHQDIRAWFLLVSQEADAVDVTTICCAIETFLNLFDAYIIENMMSADAFRKLCIGQQGR